MVFRLFRRPPSTDLSESEKARLSTLEREVAQLRGNYKNVLQSVESGARQIHSRLDRLERITQVLHLREDGRE